MYSNNSMLKITKKHNENPQKQQENNKKKNKPWQGQNKRDRWQEKG